MKNPILIIGGGIAGLTTALALQQKNVDYQVFEAVPEIKTVGAGITIAGNAMRVLKKLGVAEDVKQRGHLIYSMDITDEQGKMISALDAEKQSLKYGLDNVAIHRAELHQALLKNIPADKIITNKKAIDVTQTNNSVTIHFEDGTHSEGSAAIIADGIHSAIRKKYLPDSLPRYSGYTCWRGVVENKWNLARHAVEVWGAQGRFGYVPVGNNLVYWFACKNAPFKDAAMSKLKSNELAANFASYAQPIPDMISSTPDKDLIWSDIIDLKPINRFAFDRVLFIGDAGHATTPNLGQGACMAMEDALRVAEDLAACADDPTAAFKTFEKVRIPRTHFIVNTSYRLGKVAQLENRFLITLRNAVFRMTPARINEKQVEKVLDI